MQDWEVRYGTGRGKGNGMGRGFYFMPRHCREPLLKVTRYLRRREESGWSQREGANERESGKRVGLECMRTELMPTGVWRSELGFRMMRL